MGVRSIDAFSQYALVKEDSVLQGYGSVLEEVLRVERHGFTQTELERAKSQLLRQFQQAVKEYDKRDSRSYSSEIVRNFFVEETMPGPEAELALVEKFLPTYTVAELNQLGKTMGNGSHVVTVAGPTQMAKVSSEQLLATEKTIAARDIKPYEDADPNAKLMATAPTPGPVVKTKTIPEIGVTEWTLKNGVRVVVKPTTFANDEVQLSGFAPGGTSLAKDPDYVSAKFSDAIVGQGGIGPFDAIQLRKSLAGKIASVSARINELDENVFGTAAPNDLETFFQLVHLAFTSPRRDEKAFASWREREVESVKNRRLSPEATFYEDLQLFQTQNHPRRQPTTPELLQKVDLDKAIGFYKERFADASGWTFVVVGNVDVEPLKPLVETYLGSLPAKGRKEAWRDVKVLWPDGALTKTVIKGTEPKSSVSLTFHGPERWTRDTDNDMRMLGELLSMRLREVLREDMGGVYGVRASGAVLRRPRPEYQFTVSFGCAPDNVDKLVKAVFDEIKTLQDKGIGDDYIAKVKEQRRRAHEINLKENSFWGRELERAYTFGEDPKLILDAQPMIDKVTSDRARAAARKYFTSKEYVLGVLKPENAPH
jgi:zinc protease